MRAARDRIEFDTLMRDLMTVGFIALAAWSATGLVGVISGYLTVSGHATLRFLVAVLILVFARRTYWEIREWRWRKLPVDERFGFSSPLWERPRSGERFTIREGDVEVDPGAEVTTGSP